MLLIKGFKLMEIVQPIRSKETIKQIKDLLKQSNQRDYIMFNLGINTGLRISDILTLKVNDVRNKTHIEIREKKTNKSRRIVLNSNIYKELQEFTQYKQDDDYIFTSHRKDNRPITRIQAYRVINDVAKKVNIKESIGTHTLRKTFGYHHYKQYKDVATLQKILNHSHPLITLSYIGINNDMIDDSIMNLEI